MELGKKMEKKLTEAAMENNVQTLRELLQQDPLILDKPTSNSQGMNPLHIAAMFGKLEFVREVLGFRPDLCLGKDGLGRIPLHLAVIKGELGVLQELIHARPLSARVKTEGGGNVLHLCVMYNRLEALKLLVQSIRDEDFTNRKDDDGMTILHLAICSKQIETITYLVDENIVKVNAENANGRTALDLVKGDSTDSDLARVLESVRAKRGKDISGSEWLSRKRDAIMVVASLITTMAFQAGVSPPGGVWQEDKLDGPDPHLAGVAVMAHKHPEYYESLFRVNTVAFVSSLSTILLLVSGLPFKNRLFLWAVMMVMLLSVAAISLTYCISIVTVTPPDNTKQLGQLTRTGVSVWCGGLSILLLGSTIRWINRRLKRGHGFDLFEKLRRHGNSAAQEKSKV